MALFPLSVGHGCVAAIAFALIAAAPPAAASDVQQGLSAMQLFALADEAKAAHRSADAEAIYRALEKDPEPEIRAEARFRLGMLLAEEKRYRDAALAFRALLDEKPSAGRVRLELARVLALMGDPDAARRQLRQAQASGLPSEVALAVDQYAGALRSTKRFGGSLEVALAPDTNINRATSATTLDTVIAPLTLDRDARSQSGLGVRVGGQGYFRLPVAPRLAVLSRASVSATLYRAHQFNDVSLSLAAGPELTWKRDRLQPAAIVTRRYYGGALYAATEGASLDWRHVLGRRGQIDTAVSVARAHYALNDLQDGMLYDGSVTLERVFGARFGGSVTLSANRQTARDPGYATAAGGATLLAYRDLGSVTLFGTASYRHLGSDARLFLYRDTRRDDFYRGSIGAAFRKLGFAGLAPLMRVTWERNRSSVGIYDYRRLSVEGGVTRAF